VNPSDPERPVIECLDLSTHRVDQLIVLDTPFPLMAWSFALSPDGEWILYGKKDSDRSDIMLVEGF
jgi:hypothetical protein